MAEAKLDIVVDTSGAQKSLKSLESSFSAIKAVAVAAVAAFASKQVFDFLNAGVDAAIAQEQAMSKLGQQLKLTGEFSNAALTEFSDFADEMEKTTKFGDDLIVSQLAVAKSFGISNEQAKKLVTAAADLSAVTGDSLDQSVKQLGKTFQGLEPESVALRNALAGISKEALKSGAALDITLGRFGGSATAEVETFSGSMLQLGNSFSNFQESLGKILIENPIVIKSIQFLRKVFQTLQDIVERNKDAIGAFISGAVKIIIKSIPIAIEVLGYFIAGLQTVFQIFNLVFLGLSDIIITFTKIFIENLALAIKGYIRLGNIVGLVGDDVEKDFDSFVGGITSALDGFQETTFEITDSIDKGFNSFNEGFSSFQVAVDGYATEVENADEKIITSGEKAATGRVKAVKKVTESITDAVKDIKKVDPRILKEISVELEMQVDADIETVELNKRLGKELKNLPAGLSDEVDAQIAEFRKTQNIHDLLIDGSDTANAEILRRSKEAGKNIGGALASGIGQGGVEGARSFISGTTAAIAEAFLPGFGAAIGQVVQFLSADPEVFKAQIKAFVEGVPDVIDAIVENIPTLILVLAENSGEIITAIISNIPRLIIALVNAIPAVAEALIKELTDGIKFQIDALNLASISLGNFTTNLNAAADGFQDGVFAAGQALSSDLKGASAGFTKGLNEGLPNVMQGFGTGFKSATDKFGTEMANVGKSVLNSFSTAGKLFIDSIVQAGQRFVDKITPGGGGGGKGGVFGGKVVPGVLASGGTIPAGFNNDTFAAFLSSGELVIPTDDVTRLRAFLDSQPAAAGGDGEGIATALLSQILQVLQQPQQVSTAINIDGDRLANAILNLNRRNARLTA